MPSNPDLPILDAAASRHGASCNQPLVGVLVPVFNGEPFLGACLESLMRQTYANWQAFIMDNVSTDRTREIVSQFAVRDPRIRLIKARTHVSQSENYNRVIDACPAEVKYIKFVEADNWIYPGCLEAMVRVAESDPAVGVVGSNYLCGREILGGGIPVGTSILEGRELCRIQFLEARCFIAPPTILLYRASTLREHQPCFRSEAMQDDIELGYRILKGCKFGYVHQILSFVRSDNEGISRERQTFNPHLLSKYIAMKRFGQWYLDTDEYARLSRHWHRRYWNMLGSAAILRRDRRFWEHHRRGLETIGIRLTPWKLIGPAFRALLNWIGNPKRSLERAIRRADEGGSTT